MMFTRRQLFAGAGLMSLAAFSLPASAAKSRWPAKAPYPADFNPEEFFVELSEKGRGFVMGNPDAKLTVYITFDTQCSWCVWQYRQFEPYMDRVKFVWYPVAVLKPWSELQGAYILAAKDPAKRFLEHEAHFKDPGFRGLDVRNVNIPFELREKVWENSKVFRRSGARQVPFGVLKTEDGRYVPVAEQTGESFAKLAGL